ncbi:hypothetical protein CBR_g12123 [Chara braunii]|uniref:Reverse transcriptase/retrotransposon-derived protein RNase H-like domain-containing protein n=1 Tax=Chara braunii TaxID=69332 RepID=A0A388KRJ0_CHABU|nr:hypothetical protein CBR_g12123 [Chara braunii]|eukprot:GBG72553.1 hypothetical protein CBR_g12123 [Chara braunii]
MPLVMSTAFRSTSRSRPMPFASSTRNDVDIHNFLSRWFLGAPYERIRLQNMREFVAHGFYHRPLSELSAAYQEAVDEHVREVEAAWGIKFQEGMDSGIAFMAHTREPLRVLEKLREANFNINAKKCEWAKTQVLYLGHVLDGDGIKPEDSKMAAIKDWPTPHTLTELRSFLGLANYYRKFVRNFSAIAALRRLLKKEAIWQWDKDYTSALKRLKRALIEYPVLKVVDPSLPFVVTTDASQYGIGAVLQQDDGNGYRPV